MGKIVMKKRKYQVHWETLKSNALGIKIRITARETDKISKRAMDAGVNTLRKAISKEKLRDAGFCFRYPRARLHSNIDYDTNTVTFQLHLNHHNVTEEDFNV